MSTYVAILKSSGAELARSDKTEAIEGNVYVRSVLPISVHATDLPMLLNQ